MPKILIVDDVEDNRTIYADYLRFKGYDVNVAENGSRAIELAFAQHPDVVIMDLAMPGMTGFEAIRALKGDARTQRARIIAFTAFATFVAKELAIEAGCDRFVAKPCAPDRMETLIRDELHKRAQDR